LKVWSLAITIVGDIVNQSSKEKKRKAARQS